VLADRRTTPKAQSALSRRWRNTSHCGRPYLR
jgi:hypothetical protein